MLAETAFREPARDSRVAPLPRFWVRVPRVQIRTVRFPALGATLAVLATAVTMLVLDLAWLGIVARGVYASALGHLMRPQALWPAALLFYVFYVSVTSSTARGPARSRRAAATPPRASAKAG